MKFYQYTDHRLTAAATPALASSDARIVTGTYPQKHMKSASGHILCLYAEDEEC